mmetsp:Transcript_42746/g.87933  ORF Transcript_42746/g.87933 Transcript_42746/m.87933 type:complete len:291 (+) Transcript_42746:96-968(+)
MPRAVTGVRRGSVVTALVAAAIGANCVWQTFVSIPGGRHNTRSAARVVRSAEGDSEDNLDREDIEVWDQTAEELSLDMRELLVTDANVFLVGPDMDSYREDIKLVAERINYTFMDFEHTNLVSAGELTGQLEKVVAVPPLTSVTRFPWKVMMHGLVVWLDPDGWERRDIIMREKIRKKKFPKKKVAFGPEKAMEFGFNRPKEIDAADPIDMWQEADVHVDLQSRSDMPVADHIMAAVIDAILRSPPKWRSWMKAGKVRGTIPTDYETPYQVRREFHSYGMSPRLNKLLKA